MSAAAQDLVERLRELGGERNREGMARYGINVANAFGVSVSEIRRLARGHRRDHGLAAALWRTGVHEARILATIVDDPAQVGNEQMERWASAFDSWDLCDQACSNLFSATPLAWDKALEWSRRDEPFVKRAGFTLMACLASRRFDAPDSRYTAFLRAIERESGDDRNFVRKAVNWALRAIGKRNATLNARAIASAERIRKTGTKAGRWIASGAVRELRSDAVRERLQA